MNFFLPPVEAKPRAFFVVRCLTTMPRRSSRGKSRTRSARRKVTRSHSRGERVYGNFFEDAGALVAKVQEGFAASLRESAEKRELDAAFKLILNHMKRSNYDSLQFNEALEAMLEKTFPKNVEFEGGTWDSNGYIRSVQGNLYDKDKRGMLLCVSDYLQKNLPRETNISGVVISYRTSDKYLVTGDAMYKIKEYFGTEREWDST